MSEKTANEEALLVRFLDGGPFELRDADDLRHAILRERITPECLAAVRRHMAFLDEQRKERDLRLALLEEKFTGPGVAAARDVIRQEKP